MNGQLRFIFLWLSIILILAFSHIVFQFQLFSVVNISLALSLIAAFALKPSWPITIPLIIISELLTSEPVGVMTIALLLPSLARYFFSITTNISFTFYAWLFGTTLIQAILLALPTALRILTSADTYQNFTLPHLFPLYLPVMVFCTSVTSFAIIISYQELMPSEGLNTFMYKRRYS